MPIYSSDLCVGGTAICDLYNPKYPPSNVFDNSVDTMWASQRIGNNMENVCWIGYHFANVVNIKRMRLYTAPNELLNATGVKIGYSDDGAAWTSLQTFSIPVTGAVWLTLDITASNNTKHRYWRLMVTDYPGTSSWIVPELEMMSIFDKNSYIMGWVD